MTLWDPSCLHLPPSSLVLSTLSYLTVTHIMAQVCVYWLGTPCISIILYEVRSKFNHLNVTDLKINGKHGQNLYCGIGHILFYNINFTAYQFLLPVICLDKDE